MSTMSTMSTTSTTSTTNTHRPLIPLESFPEAVRRFVAPDAPLPAAQMLARGLVPMPPPVRVCALYQVAQLHAGLSSEAQGSLKGIPSEQLKGVVLSALPAPILGWLAEAGATLPHTELLLWALENPRLAREEAERALSLAEASALERVGANQALLERAPHLLTALLNAPHSPQLLKTRLTEWASYAGLEGYVVLHEATTEPTAQEVTEPTAQEADEEPDTAPPMAVAPPLEFSELGAPIIPPLTRAPLELSVFSPALQRFLTPEAPEAAVKMLLEGVVPMPPVTRLYALYQLALTRPLARDEAPRRAQQLSVEVPQEALTQTHHEGLIDWIAELWADHEGLMGEVVSHSSSADLTLARLALNASEGLTERVALNQRRWLMAPMILQALYFNPHLRASTSDRLIELAARERVDLSWLPESEELIASLTGASPEERAASVAVDEVFGQVLSEGKQRTPEQALSEVAEAEREALRAELEAQRGAQNSEPHNTTQEEAPKKRGGYAAIMQMNVAQKIRLALLGSQSDRAFLVKDSNKVVARAAIRSPSVSVSEALMYARNTSLNASIIEYIATNKKWMQNYRLRAQVVMNPKTPAHIALQNLNSLRPPELKAIAQSHGVPAVVSTRAKQIIKARQG